MLLLLQVREAHVCAGAQSFPRRRGEWHMGVMAQGREAPVVAKRKDEWRRDARLPGEATERGMGGGEGAIKRR